MAPYDATRETRKGVRKGACFTNPRAGTPNRSCATLCLVFNDYDSWTRFWGERTLSSSRRQVRAISCKLNNNLITLIGTPFHHYNLTAAGMRDDFELPTTAARTARVVLAVAGRGRAWRPISPTEARRACSRTRSSSESYIDGEL